MMRVLLLKNASRPVRKQDLNVLIDQGNHKRAHPTIHQFPGLPSHRSENNAAIAVRCVMTYPCHEHSFSNKRRAG
jgi:hypothetical protein